MPVARAGDDVAGVGDGLMPFFVVAPLSVWSENARAFVVEPGAYTVHVGTSADDTPHRFTVTAG